MAVIEVDMASGRPCHWCGEPLLLIARVPHAFTLADGTSIFGKRSVGMCAACDRDDPAHQGVLAFFAFYGRITRDAEALIREWVEHVISNPPAKYTDAELDEDIRAWEAGEI